MHTTETCEFCGEPFIPTTEGDTACSWYCADNADSIRQAEADDTDKETA